MHRMVFTGIAVFFLLSFSKHHNSSVDADVLKYTNELRKSNGKPALILKEQISVIARKHSANMASGKIPFGHDGFDKRQTEVKKALDDIYVVGENVAFGVIDGKAAVEMWEKSPGHRENMLGDYKYIGIGTATDSQGYLYFTQLFAR